MHLLSSTCIYCLSTYGIATAHLLKICNLTFGTDKKESVVFLGTSFSSTIMIRGVKVNAEVNVKTHPPLCNNKALVH